MKAKDKEDNTLVLFRRAAADRESGASEIEEALINGLLEPGIRLRSEFLVQGAALLEDGQPAMANLRSLAVAAERGVVDEFSEWLKRRHRALCELPKLLAANSWPWIEGARFVLTISRSTAVAEAVEGAWQRGWNGSVVVFDGTASGCGPDQASRLSQRGEAISRPDAAMPSWLERDGALVLAGADGVGPESFINSMGTRLLLEAARDRGVERLLVADTGKDVSQRVFDELVDGIPNHSDSPGRSWPVFEAVPLKLVTARIDEKKPDT